MDKPKRRYKEKTQESQTFIQAQTYPSYFTIFQGSLQLVIDDCFSYIRARDLKAHRYCDGAWDILVRFFGREFPKNQLQFYGSRQLDLYTEKSDLNVMLEPVSKGGQNILQEVVERMKEYGFCHSSKMLNSYTLEMVIDPLYQSKENQFYSFNPILVRLMFNPYYRQNFNLRSSFMMSKFLRNRANYKVVIILLKKILVDANLFNRYEGGINLYCLFLMFSCFVRYYKLGESSSAQIFKQMVKFYGQIFRPEETVIYFNDTQPCFIPLSEFKMRIDPIKIIVKVGERDEVVDLVRPLYIYDSTQRKMLEYSFEKSHMVFGLFRQLSHFVDSLEAVQANYYLGVCIKYNRNPLEPIDETLLRIVLQQSFHILYSMGFLASKQTSNGQNQYYQN